QREALAALAAIPSPTTTAVLLEMLRRGDDEIRLTLLDAGGIGASREMRDAIVELATTSSDLRVVEAATKAVLRDGATASDVLALAASVARSAGRSAARRRSIVGCMAAFGGKYLTSLTDLLK